VHETIISLYQSVENMTETKFFTVFGGTGYWEQAIVVDHFLNGSVSATFLRASNVF
jgi:phosphoketolase